MGGRGAVRHRAQCRQPQARKAWCRGHRTRVKLINTLSNDLMFPIQNVTHP